MNRKLAYKITAISILVTATVFAANVHFKSEPSVTDNGTTLTVCAALAGLGNQDITITLRTSGFAVASCRSPGGNLAPGQNKVPVTATVTETIRATEIKNGNVTFCQTTAEPRVSARAAGCPNNNWDADVTDVEFDSATITVVQGGKVVLHESF